MAVLRVLTSCNTEASKEGGVVAVVAEEVFCKGEGTTGGVEVDCIKVRGLFFPKFRGFDQKVWG